MRYNLYFFSFFDESVVNKNTQILGKVKRIQDIMDTISPTSFSKDYLSIKSLTQMYIPLMSNDKTMINERLEMKMRNLNIKTTYHFMLPSLYAFTFKGMGF
jgi:hypothetical protein